MHLRFYFRQCIARDNAGVILGLANWTVRRVSNKCATCYSNIEIENNIWKNKNLINVNTQHPLNYIGGLRIFMVGISMIC